MPTTPYLKALDIYQQRTFSQRAHQTLANNNHHQSKQLEACKQRLVVSRDRYGRLSSGCNVPFCSDSRRWRRSMVLVQGSHYVRVLWSQTDPNTVYKFQDYNQPFIDLLENLPDHEQVIVVGHSAGGLSLTYVIQKFGCRKIKMAIYVAATMLKHGFCTPEDLKDGTPDFSEYGQVTEYTYEMGPDQPPTSAIMKEEFLRKLVYNLTPDEEYRLATLMLLWPYPLRAFRGDKVQFNEGADADSVPRVYVKTLHDKVVKPEQQDAMIKRWPPCLVFALETDHSAILSAPYEFGKLLLHAAAYLQD